MKYKFLNKFQEGGEMSAEAPEAPGTTSAEGQVGGAEEAMTQVAQQLVEMLMQQIGDPQAVAAILQMALEMVAGAAQEAQPTFQRNGGRIQRVRK